MRRLCATLLALTVLGGCASREVYFVSATIPVRLGQDLHNVKVFVRDSKGDLIEGVARTIPVGTWCVSDPAEQDDKAKVDRMGLTTGGHP